MRLSLLCLLILASVGLAGPFEQARKEGKGVIIYVGTNRTLPAKNMIQVRDDSAYQKSGIYIFYPGDLTAGLRFGVNEDSEAILAYRAGMIRTDPPCRT